MIWCLLLFSSVSPSPNWNSIDGLLACRSNRISATHTNGDDIDSLYFVSYWLLGIFVSCPAFPFFFPFPFQTVPSENWWQIGIKENRDCWLIRIHFEMIKLHEKGIKNLMVWMIMWFKLWFLCSFLQGNFICVSTAMHLMTSELPRIIWLILFPIKLLSFLILTSWDTWIDQSSGPANRHTDGVPPNQD